jgi:uncharacterized repeat protein (TIGR01451 family)
VTGGDGDDTLTGGAADDVLDGGLGNDSIAGGDDNDTLVGSDGLDTIDGGTLDDLIDGGPDNDSVIGSSGSDTIWGGTGADTISGGEGDDDLSGGLPEGHSSELVDGNDLVLGEEGHDTLFGGGGDDTVSGGSDDDVLSGGDGSDSVVGDDGHDSLDGGAGSDTLAAGDGDDTMDGGAGSDTIDGGGTDFDWLIVVGSDAADTIQATLGLVGETIVSLGGESDAVVGAEIIDVRAGAGNDLVDIDPLLEVDAELYGEAGDDTLRGGHGDDVISGGAGNDSVDARDGEDIVEFYGTDSDDVITGSVDANNHVVVTYGAETDGIDSAETLFVNAGAGNDSIALAFDPLATLRLWLEGRSGDDTLVGGPNHDFVYAGGGNDSVDGAGGNDVVLAAGGDDVVSGGEGTDWIDGASGDDSILGGLDADTLKGAQGYDTIAGDDGDDVLDGAGDDDSLDGGVGNDSLYGSDGLDTLAGGAGDDSIEGGAGDDSIDASDGLDTVVGGGGSDTIEGQAGADSLYGGLGNDVITGGDGDDTLGSDEGDDIFYGGDGNDVISGGADADQLFGGEGNDVLDGGAGADRLVGGERGVPRRNRRGCDNDSLTGAAGDDTMDGGRGRDLIDPGADVNDVTADPDRDTIIEGVGQIRLTPIRKSDARCSDRGSDGGRLGDGARRRGDKRPNAVPGRPGTRLPLPNDRPDDRPTTGRGPSTVDAQPTTSPITRQHGGTHNGADLSLNLTASLDTVPSAQELGYTFDVRNAGLQAAPRVTLYDTLDDGTTLLNVSAGKWNDGKPGEPRFASAANSDSGFGASSGSTSGAADFNGDGRDDLWQVSRTANNTVAYVWLSTGSDLRRYQTWGSGFGSTNAYETGTADFNGDGRADLWQMSRTAANTVAYVWLSTGSSLQASQTWGSGFGATNSYATATADFNGDGRDDLWQVSRTASNAVAYVWLSTGSGLEAYQPWGSGFGATDEYETGTADFNGDSQADLWQVSRTTGNSVARVWLSTSSGLQSYQAWGSGLGATNDYTTQTGDFDGDYRADLWQVSRTVGNTMASVWLSTGSGLATSQAWGTGFGATNSYVTGTADFNADGRADLWQRPAGGVGAADVWLSRGASLSVKQSSGLINGSWGNVFTADLSGDGRADLWQVPATGGSAPARVWLAGSARPNSEVECDVEDREVSCVLGRIKSATGILADVGLRVVVEPGTTPGNGQVGIVGNNGMVYGDSDNNGTNNHGSADTNWTQNLEGVTITATDEVAYEPDPDDTAQFLVCRHEARPTPLHVHFKVEHDGGQITPNDYTLEGWSYATNDGRTVIIPAANDALGEPGLCAPLVVRARDDNEPEYPEYVTLWLLPGRGYTYGTPNLAKVGIADDESPRPTVTVSGSNAHEGNRSTGKFTFTLDQPWPWSLVVRFIVDRETAVDPEKSTATPNDQDNSDRDFDMWGMVHLRFNAGQTTVVQMLEPIADTLSEGTETVVVDLRPDASYIVGTATTTITIADANIGPDTLTITAIDADASEPGTDTGKFEIRRQNANGDLLVHFVVGGTATIDSDYHWLGMTAEIKDGSFTEELTVSAKDDTVPNEQDETVIVTLLKRDGIYDLGTPHKATVTIQDNDCSPVRVQRLTSSKGSIFWEGETVTYTAVLAPRNSSPNLASYKWEFRQVIAPEELLQHYGPWEPAMGTTVGNTLVVSEDEPKRGQYRVTVTSCGVSSSRDRTVFVNAAYPINFRKASGPVAGLNHLQLFYTWDSSSGRIEDLDHVLIGEYVWFTEVKRFNPLYIGTGNPPPFQPPPPFAGTQGDGHVRPVDRNGRPNGRADLIDPVLRIPITQDDHGEGMVIVSPTRFGSGPFKYTAHQVYWYQVTDDPRRTVRSAALSLRRYDIEYKLARRPSGGWTYSITKNPGGDSISLYIGAFPWPTP